jgi:hypothetical protein
LITDGIVQFKGLGSRLPFFRKTRLNLEFLLDEEIMLTIYLEFVRGVCKYHLEDFHIHFFVIYYLIKTHQRHSFSTTL